MALWNRRKPEDRTLTAQNVAPLMSSWSPVGTVTPEKATTIADAYACVRALSDAAASLPLIPYRRTPNGRTRLEGGRLVELLQRPSPGMTQPNLIGQIVAHLCLWGNCYLGKFREGDELVQLACLPPDRVQPEIKGGRLLFTVTGPKGERSVHGSEDVLHIKTLTTDGLLGLSPVKQARTILGLSDQLAKHAAVFFKNDATPAGILKLPPYGDTQPHIERFREHFRAQHEGVEKSHKIAVIAGEVEFQPLSMPLDDAQFLQQRKLSATEVCRVFRVPPWVVGADAGSSMTYSNTEQQSLHFVTYSLRPHLVAIEQAISSDPDLCPQKVYCEFLLDALLRADSKTRAEIYRMALDPVQGWMTRDEIRGLENLDPEPEPTQLSVEQILAAATNNGGSETNVVPE